jgi:integrase
LVFGDDNGSCRSVSCHIGSYFGLSVRVCRCYLIPTRFRCRNSEPPKMKKHRGMALTPAQQRMVIEAATEPWCLGTYLEVVAATGCRRGEVLALRWSDIQDGRAMVARSLTQTRDLLEFKGTKTEEPRPVRLPT